MPDLRPLRFIGEAIEVAFDAPPTLEKKPGCPQRFLWGGETFIIAELMSEWVDYARRGRFARNMQPQHAKVAAQRGSWGVGRFHFRVRTTADNYFELYYDRAPKGSDERKGAWFLVSELEQDSKSKIQDSNDTS
jgi:hypothetical protein